MNVGFLTIVSLWNRNPTYLNWAFGADADFDIGTDQPFTYTGKPFDNESGIGLHYYGARYYDAELGRFIAIDPAAAKYPSLSPYIYCANNPLKFVDPDGRANDHFMSDRDNGVRPEHIVAAAQFVNENADEVTFWGGTACYFTAGVAMSYGLEPLSLQLALVGSKLWTMSAAASGIKALSNPSEQHEFQAAYTLNNEITWLALGYIVLDITKESKYKTVYYILDIFNNVVCYVIVSNAPADMGTQSVAPSPVQNSIPEDGDGGEVSRDFVEQAELSAEDAARAAGHIE